MEKKLVKIKRVLRGRKICLNVRFNKLGELTMRRCKNRVWNLLLYILIRKDTVLRPLFVYSGNRPMIKCEIKKYCMNAIQIHTWLKIKVQKHWIPKFIYESYHTRCVRKPFINSIAWWKNYKLSKQLVYLQIKNDVTVFNETIDPLGPTYYSRSYCVNKFTQTCSLIYK